MTSNLKKKVFMVDDSTVNLTLVKNGLKDYYDVTTLPSGTELFAKLKEEIPHIILLDIVMPIVDGYQVLGVLKSMEEYANIPVIFLSSRNSEADEIRGFEMGVVDFIPKPFSLSELYNRVRLHINENEIIEEQTRALEAAHRSLMFVLTDIVENINPGTGEHVTRTAKYVQMLIEAMLQQNVYTSQIKSWNLEDVALCAALHDIGQISISDIATNKHGRLTNEEFEITKGHTTAGAAIINRVMSLTGEDKFLHNAKLFAEYHHESWDGSGYPHGLKGDAIPLHGRIMAIVDSYDSLVSEQPHTISITHEDAVDIIMEDAGTKFDPQIVAAFYSIHNKFKEEANTHEGE